MAFNILSFHALQSVFTTKYPNREHILKQVQQHSFNHGLHRRLADTIYYNLGADLARRERWNEMTRLQLQHELQKRGKLHESEEDTLSEWKLRIRLALIMWEEKEAAAKAEEKERKERRERIEKANRERMTPDMVDDHDESDEPEVTMEEVRAGRLREDLRYSERSGRAP
jgi:hypothetical protein